MFKATSDGHALKGQRSFGVQVMQILAGVALAVMLFSGIVSGGTPNASASSELSTTCRLISGGLNYTYNRAIDAINNFDSKATDLWVNAHLRLSALSDANGCNLDSDGSALPPR